LPQPRTSMATASQFCSPVTFDVLQRLNRVRSSEPAQKFAGTGKSFADGTPQYTAMMVLSEERQMYQ